MGKKFSGEPGSLLKFRLLLTNASGAFDEIEREKGIYKSFMFYLIIAIAAVVLNTLLQLITYALTLFQAEFTINIQQLFVNFIATILTPFALTLVIHPLILMFGGRAGIANTFKIIAYSLTPFLIIGLIPFIGQLSILITIFLIGYGIKSIHKLTQFKSALAIAIPLALIYLIMTLFGTLFAFGFG